MYFIFLGIFEYRKSQKAHDVSKLWKAERGLSTNMLSYVTKNQWVSEAAMWTRWVHCGWMVATIPCELFVLGVECFHTVTNQGDAHISLALKRYEHLFVQLMHDLGVGHTHGITDLPIEQGPLKKIVKRAFPSGRLHKDSIAKMQLGIKQSYCKDGMGVVGRA